MANEMANKLAFTTGLGAKLKGATVVHTFDDTPGPSVTVTVPAHNTIVQDPNGTVDPALQKADGTFINGNGISATGFNVIQNVAKGVELDLRGAHRGIGPDTVTSVDADGTVHYAGTAGPSSFPATAPI
ncbi:hypothetical protein [Alsobacter sp. SYSU BS001988]